MTALRRDAPVEAVTRTAKAEELSSWSAHSTSVRRIASAARGGAFQAEAKWR